MKRVSATQRHHLLTKHFPQTTTPQLKVLNVDVVDSISQSK